MTHKIGVPELKWMRPVLRTIIGLEGRVDILLPHEWHGKDLQDLSAWIATHPCAIGLRIHLNPEPCQDPLLVVGSVHDTVYFPFALS